MKSAGFHVKSTPKSTLCMKISFWPLTTYRSFIRKTNNGKTYQSGKSQGILKVGEFYPKSKEVLKMGLWDLPFALLYCGTAFVPDELITISRVCG